MIKPNFSTQKKELTSTYGLFELSPLPYGFGHSMGNALRRVLLSSIEGFAPTYIKINDVRHPFSIIKGVKESALEIILQIRQLKFKALGDGPFTLELQALGKTKVSAGDFRGANIEVVNKNLHIAELTVSNARLSISIIVEKGFGFSPSEEKERRSDNYLPLDSSFSPVTKVNFKVEGARVGRGSNFDKLILEIWTDASVSPEFAFKSASETLMEFFKHAFLGKENSVESESKESKVSEKIDDKVLETIIDELDLPTRVINALLRENIETVSDLIKRGKETLIDLKGVGRKSIDLIEKELKKLGVSFKNE